MLETFGLDRPQNDQDQMLLFFSFKDPLFQYRTLYRTERTFLLLNGNVTLLRRFHVDYPRNPFQVLPVKP